MDVSTEDHHVGRKKENKTETHHAWLKGMHVPECKDLTAVSISGTEPVHDILTECESIKSIEETTKRRYGKKMTLINDHMHSVDICDQ